MKKTKTVKVAAKTIKATTKTVEQIICDVVGCNKDAKPGSYGGGGSQCYICRRDVCYDHKIYDPDEPGDYPQKFCGLCFEIFIPRRREMQERHWEEEEKLEAIVKKASLAQTLA